MSVWQLVIKEIRHRKFNFAMGILSVTVAVGCMVGAWTLLRIHDLRTKEIMARAEQKTKRQMAEHKTQTKKQMDELKDDMRKAMLKLGFNVLILHEDQDLAAWYAQEFSSGFMNESYVTKLANSKVATIRHLLPSLQLKVKWPEYKRKIILIGTKGEVPFVHKNPKKPLMQPVLEGQVVLGFELHQSLGLKMGDKVKVFGREFVVGRCHGERGNVDDITAWISLDAAQDIFYENKLIPEKNLVNAILALECGCAWGDVAAVREEIAKFLPGTKVIEKYSKAIARAEARKKAGKQAEASMARAARQAHAALMREKENREKLGEERAAFSSILVPLVMAVCVVWIAFLTVSNVRDRTSEIGILRAIGLPASNIFGLFLTRAIILGFIGGLLGFAAGFVSGELLGYSLESSYVSTAENDALVKQLGMDSVVTQARFDVKIFLIAVLMAPVLAALASWLPAVRAARQDPADILREE